VHQSVNKQIFDKCNGCFPLACTRFSRQITVTNETRKRPWGFQEVETPRFPDSQHMKVVRLSALPPENIPGSHIY